MKNIFFACYFLSVGLTGFAQNSRVIDVSYVKEQLKGLDYKEQIANLNQAYRDRLHTEPELSEEIMKLTLELSTQEKDSIGMGNALYLLGKAMREHGKSSSSIPYIERSLLIFKQLNDFIRISNCLNELGISFKNLGKYQKALGYYFEALKIAKIHNYEQGEIRALSNMSVILIFQKDYEKAIEYLTKSLAMQKDEAKKNTIYNNLGIAYKALNKTDEALIYYNKSIESSKLAKDIYWQASALNNIGIIFSESGEYDKALDYFLKVEGIEKQTGNKKGLVGTFINIGVIKRSLLQYKDAIMWFQKADSLAIETKSLFEQKVIYLNLSITYENWKKYKESIDYLYHYIEIKDSLFNEKKNEQMAELVWKYKTDTQQKEIELLKQERNIKELAFEKQRWEFQLQELKAKTVEEKKQVELALLQNQNQIQKLVLEKNMNQIEKLKLNATLDETQIEAEKSKVEKETTVKNVTILISLLIVIPILILLVFYQQKIKAQSIVSIRTEQLNQKTILELIKNFEIKTFKAQLEGQEIEKKRIASDLHDGIGGNLASIKLGLNKLDDNLGGNRGIKQIMAQINETCEEIRTISHDLTPSKILNSSYIQLIREYINQSLETTPIKAIFQAYPESELNNISNQIKIEIYRIIQELLSNAIRHSQTTELDVSLNLNNEGLILMIEDTGKGFNPTRSIKGIGLLNIESRVASVNGKFNIDSIIGRGTIFTVEIPLVKQTVA
ncbi:MAG: sensor histidine kinase [Cyclobacteriaceae bacterium]|nr:sensor histidine kinase [Cyclobacteriaceae bacterium]